MVNINGIHDELLLQNDASVVPGRSARDLASAVTISLGVTTYFYAPKCTLMSAGQEFGAQRLRNGEIGFLITRNFATGAPAALWAWASPT